MSESGKRARLLRLEAELAELRKELHIESSPQEPSQREKLLLEAERVAKFGSWVWNLRSNEIVWSDELYRILGYAPQSVQPFSVQAGTPRRSAPQSV